MYKVATILLLLSVSFTSCENEIPDEVIPYTIVNEDFNLNNLQNLDLQNLGGYIYYNEAGYRGLIVYHEGAGVYRVFDRACSFDPKSTCDPVVVDESGLFLKHTCCNSTFNFNGNPTGGPASLNLLQYSAYVDGIYLKVRNQ